MIKTLKIGPLDFKIEYEDGWIIEEGNLGCCVEADHTIRLSLWQDKTKMMRTLIHEALEAYNSVYNIELKHQQINLLETCIYDFIISNLDVVDEIEEATK